MAAGWLRLVLEQAGLPVQVVNNEQVAAGDLEQFLDVLVLPPIPATVLVGGPSRRGVVPLPEQYRRGIGAEGVAAIHRFIRSGGVVIGFQTSAEWLAETLEIGVENELRGRGQDQFHCPGALLAIQVDQDHPTGWGLPARPAAMVEGSFGFRTHPVPAAPSTRAVVARFPDEELLLSGWIRGEEHLRRRAAVVEAQVGQGRVVLFSFAPFFRGQTRVTLPLLLNAVFNAGLDQTPVEPQD